MMPTKTKYRSVPILRHNPYIFHQYHACYTYYWYVTANVV